ncbi:hypothetical protein TWF594_007216 [Orbilia oligospora]|nr:hypothetical protein TWF594_007216 [Orbilia oligospora]
MKPATSLLNRITKPSPREPDDPKIVQYEFSFSFPPGYTERIESASVTGSFAQKSFKTYELRGRAWTGVFQKLHNASDVVIIERPRSGPPFDGKVYYYFTINGRRTIDESRKKEERWFFGQDGHRWNILEREDLIPGVPPPPPRTPLSPPAPPPSRDMRNRRATIPIQVPPKVEDVTNQQVVPATITPRVRPRLNIQPRNGICLLFFLQSDPEIKEVSVTGIYDAWGRKRTENLIWNPKTNIWEISLRISIPPGQENIESTFIVKRPSGPRSTQKLTSARIRGQPIDLVNISEPVFIPTRFTGMSPASTYFATVIEAKFPGSNENSRFAIAGGDVNSWNAIAGELKWNPINSTWEVRVVFDWIKRSEHDKFHFQIREFLGENIGWKNVIDKNLPHEEVELTLDTDVEQRRRGPPPKITRNYIPISNAYETKWPFVESIFALGKYTFFWSAPTSPTRINRVSVEGPFAQDPSIRVSRELKCLPDGTWSLTLELPVRRMRYRYLVDGMYQTNWHENREMDENNERWNFLQEGDFVVEDDGEDDADITITRSTLKRLLEGSLELEQLSPELREIVASVKPKDPAPDRVARGFELSEHAKKALYL